ncbi:hypothetical protein JAAARDRAFT_192537 [Jaapia argillacea MUCL 33604]|uniref:Uncharacterized protein n=1 Tax=Jaapia argillacea MUCL 33604 TaxID=933084 RepID=A0A067Q8R6_9AGAM|nr:hypothetical protein JAAARDRAFT_192537 [Jaapia argillacea MUCL 33604]
MGNRYSVVREELEEQEYRRLQQDVELAQQRVAGNVEAGYIVPPGARYERPTFQGGQGSYYGVFNPLTGVYQGGQRSAPPPYESPIGDLPPPRGPVVIPPVEPRSGSPQRVPYPWHQSPIMPHIVDPPHPIIIHHQPSRSSVESLPHIPPSERYSSRSTTRSDSPPPVVISQPRPLEPTTAVVQPPPSVVIVPSYPDSPPRIVPYVPQPRPQPPVIISLPQPPQRPTIVAQPSPQPVIIPFCRDSPPIIESDYTQPIILQPPSPQPGPVIITQSPPLPPPIIIPSYPGSLPTIESDPTQPTILRPPSPQPGPVIITQSHPLPPPIIIPSYPESPPTIESDYSQPIGHVPSQPAVTIIQEPPPDILPIYPDTPSTTDFPQPRPSSAERRPSTPFETSFLRPSLSTPSFDLDFGNNYDDLGETVEGLARRPLFGFTAVANCVVLKALRGAGGASLLVETHQPVERGVARRPLFGFTAVANHIALRGAGRHPGAAELAILQVVLLARLLPGEEDVSPPLTLVGVALIMPGILSKLIYVMRGLAHRLLV